jgi:3-isopropylmalate/(R)-2-methylmalate dehydratase large subunit
MATECSAKSGICEVDDTMLRWIVERAARRRPRGPRAKVVGPIRAPNTPAAMHTIDLASIAPMVATPGDAARRRPTQDTARSCPSWPSEASTSPMAARAPPARKTTSTCTPGSAEAERAGQRLAPGVKMFIQYGSADVEAYAHARATTRCSPRLGVEVIKPGCGACIGCGPGVSDRADQVTVSAINRNYKGRSGPGQLYLASPLTVAASAIRGKIVEYREGMFGPGADGDEPAP